MSRVTWQHTGKGGVPGGHPVLYDGRKPFVPPMAECHSIPLRESDVVVDIGAYCGTFALYCARHPVKLVRAYEPTPASFQVLSLHSQLRNLELVQAAVVGDDRPEVELWVSKGIGVTNSVVLSRRKAGAIPVPAVSYEEAVRGASIVKVDVEGAEYTYQQLVQPGIRGLIIDFHPIPSTAWQKRAQEMVDQIEAAGFQPVITPQFQGTCGWLYAGSWVREVDTRGECLELTQGEACTGCGVGFQEAVGAKALCPECMAQWRPKHSAGFSLGAV